MDFLHAAVMHSEHRSLWKPIDLNQRVRGGELVSSLQQIFPGCCAVEERKKKAPPKTHRMWKTESEALKIKKIKNSGMFEGAVLTCQLAVSCTSMLFHQLPVLKN